MIYTTSIRVRFFLAFALFVNLFSASLLFAETNGAKANDADWTKEDSLTSAGFIQGIVKTPEKIDSLIKGSIFRDHDLGFGFLLREAWVHPADKLGFSIKIIYSQKSLPSSREKQKESPATGETQKKISNGIYPISFEIKPVLNYRDLNSHYRKALEPIFKTRMTAKNELKVEPFYWNFDRSCEPLPRELVKSISDDSITSPVIKKAIAFYMSPYSGTVYGMRGGEAGQILENRFGFLNLLEMLMADRKISRYLLRSYNPATRLTAVEFIERHQGDFDDYANLKKNQFRIIFSHPKKVATLHGRKESLEDAKKLVEEFSTQEFPEKYIQEEIGILRTF